jgi:hypothetical protein
MSNKPKKGLYGGFKPGSTGKKGSKGKKPKKSYGPSKEAVQARDARKAKEARERAIDNSVIGRDPDEASPFKAIPPQLIAPLVKGAAGALGGGYTAGMGELQQIKEEFKEKDFKNQKFGKKLGMLAKAGLRGFSAYQQGMLGGAVKGLTGSDMGIGSVGFLADNQPGAQQQPQEEQPIYTTNINPMTGEETPLQMLSSKPLKMLTPIKMSYEPLKMSAKEAERSELMMELSGSKTLSPNMMLGDLDKDGKMSEYEQARQDAIEKNMKKQK